MKMIVYRILIVAEVVLLASCVTPTKYAADTNGYGYREVQIDSTAYQVSFKGNSETAPEDISRYALFRCAELTDQEGFDYFILLDDKNAATTSSGETWGYNSDNEWAPKTTVYTEHSDMKTIRMYKGIAPTGNPQVYSAKSLLKYMGPTVQR